jgi:hypothetical protein
VEEMWVHGENHWPVANHCQTIINNNVISSNHKKTTSH